MFDLLILSFRPGFLTLPPGFFSNEKPRMAHVQEIQLTSFLLFLFQPTVKKTLEGRLKSSNVRLKHFRQVEISFHPGIRTIYGITCLRVCFFWIAIPKFP